MKIGALKGFADLQRGRLYLKAGWYGHNKVEMSVKKKILVFSLLEIDHASMWVMMLLLRLYAP